MICLGIDPDTKNVGLAAVRQHTGMGFEVLRVGVASVRASLPIEERILSLGLCFVPGSLCLFQRLDSLVQRVVVEGQYVYPRGLARPNDLIHLAQVTGLCLAHADTVLAPQDFWVPYPRQWKGTVRKDAHQRRILREVGLDADLTGVSGAEKLTKTQKGHVVDAIGLAVWGLKQ